MIFNRCPFLFYVCCALRSGRKSRVEPQVFASRFSISSIQAFQPLTKNSPSYELIKRMKPVLHIVAFGTTPAVPARDQDTFDLAFSTSVWVEAPVSLPFAESCDFLIRPWCFSDAHFRPLAFFFGFGLTSVMVGLRSMPNASAHTSASNISILFAFGACLLMTPLPAILLFYPVA